jgi:ABC-type multidrug transport system ATPase subunit
MTLLAAHDLGHRFGSRWLFRHLEIELRPGDVLGVVGRNGSGKSTLLRALGLLLSPAEGEVRLGGGRDPRLALGYSGIDLNLYPALTAREHMAFAARVRGIEEGSLDDVGLADAADRPAGQFSTGMRARLKLALALQSKPDVLLLDEPSAALDAEGQDLVARAIDRQRASGAVAIATNDSADRRYLTHVLEIG